MKKMLIYSAIALLGTAASTFGVISATKDKNVDIISSTSDFVNDQNGINKIDLKSMRYSSSKLSTSKIYAQTATDSEGNDYLRFATAVKGNISKITYTRHIEGLSDKTTSVTSLYKGITANEEANYFNGGKLINCNVTSSKDYYWACYTIKFTSETYKSSDITISINIDGYEDTRTVSLYDLMYGKKQENMSYFDMMNKYYEDVKTIGAEKISKDGGYGFIQGLTTDGENLYYLITKGNSKAKIIKINPATGNEEEILSDIAIDGIASRDAGNFRLINNKFYIIKDSGSLLCYDLESKNYVDNDLNFNDFEGKLKDLEYSLDQNLYLAINENQLVQFFDANMNKVNTSFKVSCSSSGYSLKNIRADKDYIYVVYSSTKKIIVEIYDYSGNKITFNTINDSRIFPVVTYNCGLSNLIFFNNKVYISGLSWNSNVHFSGLSEISFKESSKDNSPFLELKGYSNLTGETLEDSYETITKTFTIGDYVNFQGACTDYTNSRYAYYAMTDVKNTKGIVMKFDFELDAVVGYSKEFITSADETISPPIDNSNMFYYNGKIYIIDANGNFASIVAADITAANKGDITQNDTSLDFGLTNISAAAYSNVYNKFAVAANGKLHIFSSSLEKLNDGKEVTLPTSKSKDISFLYSNGDSLFYGIATNSESKKNTSTDTDGNETTTSYSYNTISLTEYNWNGYKISNYKLGNETNSIGEIYSEAAHRRVRNMVIVDDNLYFSTISWDKINGRDRGNEIHKLIVNNASEIMKETNKLSLGEYVEANKALNKENSFVANPYIKNDKTFGKSIQGVTTDGENLYFAHTSDKNLTVTISKINPNNYLINNGTNQQMGTTPIEVKTANDYEDAGKIFFYNNQIWVVKYNTNVVLGIDKDTLNANTNTMTFNLPSGVAIQDIDYNVKNEVFVILGTDGYVYQFKDENTKSDVEAFNVGKNKSITINDTYIYVSNSVNNNQHLTVKTYDYAGNMLVDAFNLGASNICDSNASGSTFNTQAFIEYKGLIILVALGWGGNYAGGHVYAISMK